jgi:hypothetical protein
VVNRLEATPLAASRRAADSARPDPRLYGRLPLALGAGAGLTAVLVLRWKHGPS